MRGRRTVCFITLKVREVATYISRPSALTRERKKKPRDRFLHHGKRSSPPSESENERFREWWMTRAGSLANCEQAKCSSGFAALGWRRSECGNQPCDPTVENRIRYIYIYIRIMARLNPIDRGDVSKMNVPITSVEMLVTMFGRDPLNMPYLVAVDRSGCWPRGSINFLGRNMNRDWEDGRWKKKKKEEASSLPGYWLIRGFVFRWWSGICCKSIRDIELRSRGTLGTAIRYSVQDFRLWNIRFPILFSVSICSIRLITHAHVLFSNTYRTCSIYIYGLL